MSEKYNFQYCQKIVIYSKDGSEILLCKRKGEEDYDGVYSFIGGKMETADNSIVEGLKREKDEEVGNEFKVRIFPTCSTNIFFVKNDGSRMILPHYYAVHEEGEIELNKEYSEYTWVPLAEVGSFEPKIPNIPEILAKFEVIKNVLSDTESVLI